MTYDVLLAHTPTEYQKKVKECRDNKWTMSMIHFVVENNMPTWVITIQHPENPIEAGRMQ